MSGLYALLSSPLNKYNHLFVYRRAETQRKKKMLGKISMLLNLLFSTLTYFGEIILCTNLKKKKT